MTNVVDVAKKCLQDEAQAILNLIPKLDDDFTRAIELIIGSKGKLIVTGVGKSGHIGVKIASTMASTGTPAFFVNPLANHSQVAVECIERGGCGTRNLQFGTHRRTLTFHTTVEEEEYPHNLNDR